MAAVKRKATKKKAKKAPSKAKEPGSRIDWSKAFLFYCESLERSYEDVATKFKCHAVTVRHYGRQHDWVAERLKLQDKIISDGIHLAGENLKKGTTLLLAIEQEESLLVMEKLQGLRKKKSEAWDAMGWTRYMTAFEKASLLRRRAFGLPTEIIASPGQAKASYEDAIRRSRARRKAAEKPVDA